MIAISTAKVAVAHEDEGRSRLEPQATADRTLRICIFARTFAPVLGGLERIAEILASEFAAAGHPVEVLTDTPDPGNQHGEQSYRVTRTQSMFERLRAMSRSDVVVFMNVSLVGLAPALLSRKPIVFTHHASYKSDTPYTWLAGRLKMLATLTATNICCSDFVASHLPGRSHVITNAYDDKVFRRTGVAPPDRDFAFCGRLVSDKGADLLIRSFAIVAARIPDATLTIIGDGPERSALERLAGELGVRELVRFTGSLKGAALPRELERHVCFIVPSIWEEPFGIVALEGLAMCQRVIVTRRGGLPQAVGPCGTIVEPDVEALAAEMLRSADARSRGQVQPDIPDETTRQEHLARHTMEPVARRYLEAIKAAALPHSKDARL